MPAVASNQDIQDLVATPPVFQLLSVASPMDGDDGHLNPTWRGLVGTSNASQSSTAMAIKYLGEKSTKIAIELACALAAISLKIPVPRPALVFADRSDLPNLPYSIQGDTLLLFGSTFTPEDTFWAKLQKNRVDAADHVWKEVCKSDVGGKGAAWDELIANTDRHHHNLLFDGNKWWLFDHDKAIPSAQSSFIPEELSNEFPMFFAKVNLLATEMLQRRKSDHKLLDVASSINLQQKRIKYLSTLVAKWVDPDSRIQGIYDVTGFLIGLISARLPALAMHISARINGTAPDTGSLWTSPDQN